MSKIVVKKVCQFCGKEFIAHKMNTMYCSHQCSQRSYKVRLREQKLENVLQKENLPPVTSTTLKKEYLSCDDVADLMGVSSTTVYRYCITGKIKCVNMNRKIFIRKLDIDALFQVDVPYQVKLIEATTYHFTIPATTTSKSIWCVWRSTNSQSSLLRTMSVLCVCVITRTR